MVGSGFGIGPGLYVPVVTPKCGLVYLLWNIGPSVSIDSLSVLILTKLLWITGIGTIVDSASEATPASIH